MVFFDFIGNDVFIYLYDPDYGSLKFCCEFKRTPSLLLPLLPLFCFLSWECDNDTDTAVPYVCCCWTRERSSAVSVLLSSLSCHPPEQRKSPRNTNNTNHTVYTRTIHACHWCCGPNENNNSDDGCIGCRLTPTHTYKGMRFIDKMKRMRNRSYYITQQKEKRGN